jgi:hypothetical protein
MYIEPSGTKSATGSLFGQRNSEYYCSSCWRIGCRLARFERRLLLRHTHRTTSHQQDFFIAFGTRAKTNSSCSIVIGDSICTEIRYQIDGAKVINGSPGAHTCCILICISICHKEIFDTLHSHIVTPLFYEALKWALNGPFNFGLRKITQF